MTDLRYESQGGEQQAGGCENRSDHPAHKAGFEDAYFSVHKIFCGNVSLSGSDSVRNRFGVGPFDACFGKIAGDGKGVDHGAFG